MTVTGIKFGNITITAPCEVSFTNNKIWSQNTGRSSNGKMVGDIICIKKTITLKWANLNGNQVKAINDYISNQFNAFFDVTIMDETFDDKIYTVYASDPTYEIWGWDERRRLVKNLAVDLIEQ